MNQEEYKQQYKKERAGIEYDKLVDSVSLERLGLNDFISIKTRIGHFFCFMVHSIFGKKVYIKEWYPGMNPFEGTPVPINGKLEKGWVFSYGDACTMPVENIAVTREPLTKTQFDNLKAEPRKEGAKKQEKPEEQEKQKREKRSPKKEKIELNAEDERAMRILGLEDRESLDAEKVEKAFRKLAREYHPDAVGADKQKQALAEVVFREVMDARNRLLKKFRDT